MAEDKKALSLKERLVLQRVEEGDEAIKEEGTANSTWSGASSSTAGSSLCDLGAADNPEDLGDDLGGGGHAGEALEAETQSHGGRRWAAGGALEAAVPWVYLFR